MSNVVVGLFLALGVGAWTYSKTMQRTGNNARASLILTAIAALFAFVVGVTVMIMVASFTEG
jgi:ABC-type dipeptide/oligopeptide/nickel transport system permease component